MDNAALLVSLFAQVAPFNHRQSHDAAGVTNSALRFGCACLPRIGPKVAKGVLHQPELVDQIRDELLTVVVGPGRDDNLVVICH
ncbi:MAG: hypothetical protein ABI459_09220, partial [Deltaproteobacteria bacterium]